VPPRATPTPLPPRPGPAPPRTAGAASRAGGAPRPAHPGEGGAAARFSAPGPAAAAGAAGSLGATPEEAGDEWDAGEAEDSVRYGTCKMLVVSQGQGSTAAWERGGGGVDLWWQSRLGAGRGKYGQVGTKSSAEPHASKLQARPLPSAHGARSLARPGPGRPDDPRCARAGGRSGGVGGGARRQVGCQHYEGVLHNGEFAVLSRQPSNP
jgi:hypothetical protein